MNAATIIGSLQRLFIGVNEGVFENDKIKVIKKACWSFGDTQHYYVYEKKQRFLCFDYWKLVFHSRIKLQKWNVADTFVDVHLDGDWYLNILHEI